MPTLNAIVTRFLEETGVGIFGTADSAPNSGSTVTDLTVLGNATGTHDYDGHWVWFPLATGNNIVKRASTVVTTTGVLTVTTAYSSNSATAYRVLRPEYHPTFYVVPLVNRALEHCWQWWRSIVTVIPNGDSESSSVGGSDSNASTTRDTTAADVWQGEASLRVANSGANGYHQYDTFDAAAGQPFKVGVFLRITTGTSCFARLMDITNSATIAEITGIAGVGQWHYIQLEGSFPANCYSAALRVGSTGATDDTNWDDAFCVWGDQTKLVGPSWATDWITDNGEKAFRLYKARNRLQDSSSSAPARAYDLELLNDDEYQVLNIPTGANPIEIELGRRITSQMYPIVIEARRKYSDFGALSADTDSTDCPLPLVIAAMKWLAAEERGLPQAVLWLEKFKSEQRKSQSALTSPAVNQRGLAYMRL